MKHLFRIFVLAGLLINGSFSQSEAAFVKHRQPVVTQQPGADGAVLNQAAAIVSVSAGKGLAPLVQKAKKAGLFARIGAWYAKQMAGDNQIVALVLSVVLGYLAVDRFYLGRTFTGLLKLFTLGGFGIWYIIDVVLIATGALKPRRGEYSETI